MSSPIGMQLGQSQSLKQTQRLIMSPQMQQAIHLLQLPVQELASVIEAEMARNPILEIEDNTSTLSTDLDLMLLENEIHEEISNDSIITEQRDLSFSDQDFSILHRLDEEFRDYFTENEIQNSNSRSEEDKLKQFQENNIVSHPSLFDHLMRQLCFSKINTEEKQAAEIIIGSLDEKGFLSCDLQELAILYAIEPSLLEDALFKIQALEPFGIAARNLQESLLIQMRCLGKQNTLAYRIIEKYYEDLLHNRVPHMQKGLNCSAQDIIDAVQNQIRKLSLQPANSYEKHIVPYTVADARIVLEQNQLGVQLNDEDLPNLRLNYQYVRMLEDQQLPEETKSYIQEKISSGKWLVRNIHQRNETLYRILELLLQKQKNFFSSPTGALQPLTMKVIAEELQLHESTIARAVANKYIDSPRGMLSLRSFFTNAYVTEEGEDISSQTVKKALHTLIQAEKPHKPYSDEKLSQLLQQQGIPCARRTVAKYRQELGIGNTTHRRKYH